MATSAGKIILLYSTAPSRNEARRLVKILIEKKLIACGNIFKIESLYKWKGKIAGGAEWVILAKTADSKFLRAKKEIEKIHPYEIPCIIKMPATAGEKYFKWVEKEIA